MASQPLKLYTNGKQVNRDGEDFHGNTGISIDSTTGKMTGNKKVTKSAPATLKSRTLALAKLIKR